MTKGSLIYEGKAKRLYAVEGHPELLFQEFKDSLTALNGLKKEEHSGKGRLNRDISSLIFRYLKKNGTSTHWVQNVEPVSMITEKVTIIPLEVVVRNILAGSLAKKAGRAEGEKLESPIVDLHFKDDALADPFISEEQAVYVFKTCSFEDVKKLKSMALKINVDLTKLFARIGLLLVDFKLEFGRRANGEIVLADEISPDSCRLWDLKTGEKRDKDRFRRDMGGVIEAYQWVWNELSKTWGEEL